MAYGAENAGLPAFVEADPEDRLTVVNGVLEQMKQESISPIEAYVMQKAIALFLLGERVGWSQLYGCVAQHGLAELSQLKISDMEDDNEVIQAMNSLERRGLLHFEEDNSNRDTIMRIGSLMNKRRAFVRSVFHFERKRAQE